MLMFIAVLAMQIPYILQTFFSKDLKYKLCQTYYAYFIINCLGNEYSAKHSENIKPINLR